MSYGGVGDASATTPKNDFYKHTANDSVRSSTVSQTHETTSAYSSGGSQRNQGKENVDFLEDKVLFWSSVVVTIVFTFILLPIGGVSAYKLYNRDTSNFYDFDDSVDSLIHQSDAIAKQYAGKTMNLAPVFINIQMNNAYYYIDTSPQSQKLFRFASELSDQIGKSAPYSFGAACADVASYFNDFTAFPERYISGDHYSALFKLAWRHDKVNKDEKDSLDAFIRQSALFADGNFTFTLTGPGLMQSNDSPAIIIGFFAPFYIVVFFLAVMARSSGFALIVPVIFISCTTVIAAGSLLVVDHALPVTSFSIVITIATSLALTGMSTITLMQRLAGNFMYDESHSRSISRRVYLAYTDMKESMFLPFVMAMFLFCVSAIKDEASKSITLCCGLGCCVVFMCNYTLLPACAIFTYPLVYPENARWTRFTSCLPRYLRRPTPEEMQSAQLLASAAGHENDGRADDSVLLQITSKVRKFSLAAILVAVIFYVAYTVVLFTTSMKVRYNYDSVVRHEDSYVSSLQAVSRTYGIGAQSPWFVIIELDPTTQYLSQNDFNRMVVAVNSAIVSPALEVSSKEFIVAPVLFENEFLDFKTFELYMNSENIDQKAMQFRNIFRSCVTPDSKYAVIKFFPPSKLDNYINTYAEYMMHVENFAILLKSKLDSPNKFWGAYGPSAGMWNAMNQVNDDFKIVLGVSIPIVALIYAIVTRGIAATAHGVVAAGLNMMRCFFYAAIATKFGGFYYVVSPVLFAVALAYFLHADIVNLVEMLRIRGRNRWNEERCNAELVNRTEHIRWGWLVVFLPYFLMVFSLTEILSTFGLGIAMLALGDLFLYRIIFIPAFNSVVAERFGLVKGYWWPRDVNEPRTSSEELQA